MSDKYLELDKRLAALLGYKAQIHYRFWTDDGAQAFNLMVAHDVYPSYSKVLDQMFASHWSKNSQAWVVMKEQVADHPNKETAAKVALVRTVIAKLEQEA